MDDRLLIRPGMLDDATALARIYNHYIEHTSITFDLVPVSAAQRRTWIGGFDPTGRHRLLVGTSHGEPVGWASSQRFRHKAAYDTSVEVSIYLSPDHTRRGWGAMLYAALFDALADQDLHRAYAGMTLPNPGSLALHTSFGFAPLGVYREVGRKFGKWWDVQWFEKAL